MRLSGRIRLPLSLGVKSGDGVGNIRPKHAAAAAARTDAAVRTDDAAAAHTGCGAGYTGRHHSGRHHDIRM